LHHDIISTVSSDGKWKAWSLRKESRVPRSLSPKEFSGYPLNLREDSNEVAVGAQILAESHKNNYSSGIHKGIFSFRIYNTSDRVTYSSRYLLYRQPCW
jgi:hypothetical protein